MADIGLFSLDDDGVVEFSFSNMDRIVKGPEEALQLVAAHMFTTPGSNTYNREEGGGLRRLISAPLKGDSEIQAEAAIIVSRTQSSVVSSQSVDKPADATVTGLKLHRVTVSRATATIDMAVLINLLDGNSFQATFRVT